jgi:uncharacterized BrkB/YihY/UPF0761 family membrane protein
MATARLGTRRRRHPIAAPIAETFAEHNLLTYGAAIAFQGLIALVPLTLLGLGLLGATGHKEVWTNHVEPAIQGRVTQPVYRAIDHTVSRILDHGTAGLIAFSVLLSLWYLTAAMRAVIEALNRIHDVDDDRRWWHRILIAAGLGAAAGVVLYGSAVLVIGGPRGAVLGIVRWGGAVLLLGLLVALLVRFAPAQGEVGEPRRRLRRRLLAGRLAALPALHHLPRGLQEPDRDDDLAARADHVPLRLLDRLPGGGPDRRAAPQEPPDVVFPET